MKCNYKTRLKEINPYTQERYSEVIEKFADLRDRTPMLRILYSNNLERNLMELRYELLKDFTSCLETFENWDPNLAQLADAYVNMVNNVISYIVEDRKRMPALNPIASVDAVFDRMI